jgi:hypothetical protein
VRALTGLWQPHRACAPSFVIAIWVQRSASSPPVSPPAPSAMLLSVGRSLRGLLQQAATRQAAPAIRSLGAAAAHDDDEHDEPSYEHTPTVFDRLVTLHVVDLRGKRHTIQSLAGESLSKTLIDAGFPAVSIMRHECCGAGPAGLQIGCARTLRRADLCSCPADLLLSQHGLLHAAHCECVGYGLEAH